MAQWFVIGAGYTGKRLIVRLLAEGGRVTATRLHGGEGTIALDFSRPETVRFSADAVVVCVAPAGEQSRQLIDACWQVERLTSADAIAKAAVPV
jgi:nucleoside-diphosphate-sugar epimerase